MINPQTLGDLIDRLTIINIKIYWCVEIILKCDGPAELLAVAAKNAQTLNDQRSKLKNAIDTAYGIDLSELEIKTTEPDAKYRYVPHGKQTDVYDSVGTRVAILGENESPALDALGGPEEP